MASISEEEIQQLLRTVEMFEAITKSQPEDYQSWEILKEAYAKLGRRTESLLASKKLAKAHISLGQISQAILEYEGILQEHPNDPEVLKDLKELEAKTSQLAANRQPSGAPLLREDSKPTPLAPALAAGTAAPPSSPPPPLTHEDGNKALIDVLIAEKMLTPQAVEPLVKRLTSGPVNTGESPTPFVLAQLLIEEQLVKLDDMLTVLVNRSGLPYLPLFDLRRGSRRRLPAPAGHLLRKVRRPVRLDQPLGADCHGQPVRHCGAQPGGGHVGLQCVLVRDLARRNPCGTAARPWARFQTSRRCPRFW